jgi:hypothetical protein
MFVRILGPAVRQPSVATGPERRVYFGNAIEDFLDTYVPEIRCSDERGLVDHGWLQDDGKPTPIHLTSGHFGVGARPQR